jgi:hypothetical protein
MKGLFLLLIGSLTGSPTLFLDGEESSNSEDNSTKAKSDTVQTNKSVSQDNETLSPNESKDNSSSSSSEQPKVLVDNRSISEKFEQMYLALHEHEEKLLKNEKDEYDSTGYIPEESHHSRMAESRKNDQINLINHIKSFNSVPEEDTGLTDNKREHDNTQDEDTSNKVQKK